MQNAFTAIFITTLLRGKIIIGRISPLCSWGNQSMRRFRTCWRAESSSYQSQQARLPELCVTKSCLTLPVRRSTKLRTGPSQTRLKSSKMEVSFLDSSCPWPFWMCCIFRACQPMQRYSVCSNTSLITSLKLWKLLSSHDVHYATLLAFTEEKGLGTHRQCLEGLQSELQVCDTPFSRAVGKRHFTHSLIQQTLLEGLLSSMTTPAYHSGFSPNVTSLGKPETSETRLGPHSILSWSIFYFLFHRALCTYNWLNIPLTTISVTAKALPVFFSFLPLYPSAWHTEGAQ